MGFFSNIYWRNLFEVLEVNLTILCAWQGVGGEQWLCLPGVSNSQINLLWASSNSSSTVQDFLSQHCFPWCFLLVNLCSGMPWFPLNLLLVSPILGLGVCPEASTLLQILEECWFFCLFSFLLVVRTEWWLPSSLHGRNWNWKSPENIF